MTKQWFELEESYAQELAGVEATMDGEIEDLAERNNSDIADLMATRRKKVRAPFALLSLIVLFGGWNVVGLAG